MNFKCRLNEGLIRILLVAFNFIFCILSIALIALGIVYLDSLWWPPDYTSLNFIKLPYFLIVLGSLSFIASLAGCYFARVNSKKYLIAFMACLIVLLAFELTVSIIAFSNTGESLSNNTKIIIQQEYYNQDHKDEFHKIESLYDCCGISGAKDSLSDGIYCCQNVCDPDLLNTTDVITKFGCADMVVYKIQDASIQTGVFTFIYSILQVVEISLLGLVFLQ